MKKISQLKSDVEASEQTYSDIQQYYINNEGRFEKVDESRFSKKALEEVSSSIISPVQKIEDMSGTPYYGVAEYEPGGDEWYGFKAFDQRVWDCRRVVGISEAKDGIESEEELSHATAGDPTGSFRDKPNATYEELANKLKEHYEDKFGKDRDVPSMNKPPAFSNARMRRRRGRPDNPGNSQK